MDRGKRRPIKSKMRRGVLLISVISLLLLSIEALVSMFYIRSRSKETLISKMEQNLNNTADNRAELVNAWLQKYSEEVSSFAEYIHNLYVNPELVKEMEVAPVSADNKGKLVMQPAKISEKIREEDIAGERMLLGNLQLAFYPVLTENEDVIVSAYFATERGLTMAYDKQSDLKVDYPYFPALDTDWYKLAKEKQTTVFTDVYQDSFGKGLTITCAAPFYEADDSFAGVVAMDILITDLYRSAISMDLEEESYAFLVDNQGKVISPNLSGEALENEEGLDSVGAARILSEDSGLFLSQEGVYFCFASVNCTEWKYCIRIPESVVLSSVIEMDQAIRFTILVFAMVFALSVITILLFARRFADSVTRPIIALGNDTRQISEGNLDHRAIVSSNDEIGDLAVRFNTMAAKLEDYVEDLTRITADRERIRTELNVATQIQADLLPKIYPAFPEIKEFDIWATMDPAKEVGGDFYDFFLIDESHLGIVIADVSGKGVPAALFMAIAKTLIKNSAQMGGTPSEILATVNDQLCYGNEAQFFVTAWFAILDVNTGKGLAANAGHEHPVLKRRDGSFELVMYRHSPPLAAMEGMIFTEHEFELHPGDTIFVYTDGAPEATNANDESYGTSRMLDALNRDPDADLHTLLQNVRKDLDAFVNGAPQFDDITMLGLLYYGKDGK